MKKGHLVIVKITPYVDLLVFVVHSESLPPPAVSSLPVFQSNRWSTSRSMWRFYLLVVSRGSPLSQPRATEAEDRPWCWLWPGLLGEPSSSLGSSNSVKTCSGLPAHRYSSETPSIQCMRTSLIDYGNLYPVFVLQCASSTILICILFLNSSY